MYVRDVMIYIYLSSVLNANVIQLCPRCKTPKKIFTHTLARFYPLASKGPMQEDAYKHYEETRTDVGIAITR